MHGPARSGIVEAVELIAHRAGNLVASIAPAAEVADAVEIDVHLFRNRLEVRHAKLLLWPFRRLWEKWELLPPDAARPSLGEIAAAVPDGTAMWLDLKGFTTRLPRAALAAVGDREGLTCSTRQWWLLRRVRRTTSARTMRSVGSRWQRRLAVELGSGSDGIAIDERLLDDTWLERLGQLGPVVAWGVRDRARADALVAAGIDGLILDDLGLIRELRGGRKVRT